MVLSLHDIHEYIRKLGWTEEIPRKWDEAQRLLNNLEKKAPPSPKQIEFLRSLGCPDQPESMRQATEWITQWKIEKAGEIPATERQIDYLSEIAEVLGLRIDFDNLTKSEASALIDKHADEYKELRDILQDGVRERWRDSGQTNSPATYGQIKFLPPVHVLVC